MSALLDELRKKYGTPQEAIRALGLDESLVGDATTLVFDPPVSEKQRKAMFAAASGHSTLGIPKKVGEEFVGKAKDKSMKRADDKKAKDIASVRVGDNWPKAARDEFEKMVGKDKADEFCAKDWDPDDAEDESEEEIEAAKEAVRDKKAKDAKRADDKKAMDAKKAKDAEEEEAEEVNEGKKDVKQSEDKKAKDSKRADDKRADDRRADDKRADDKHAMDEAIASQVDRAAAVIEKAIDAKYRDRYAAAEMVRPYIGEVSPMAFDSGDAIKVHALEKLGVKDVSDLSGKALDKLLGYQQKLGARPVERLGKSELAMDSSTKADACKYAPGLAKVTIGV